MVAADSEGSNVTDRLDIHVQQHKLSRSVNHEFSVYLRIDKRSEFPTEVDWELKVRVVYRRACTRWSNSSFLVGNSKHSRIIRR